MSSADQVAFWFFWAWIGFSSMFTVLLWAWMASVTGRESNSGKSTSAKFRNLSIRILVMSLAIGGMFGIARLWGRGIVESTTVNAVALWVGILFALIASYAMRKVLFRSE